MSSEPRPAPFRIPEGIFAELAAGGGSAVAVEFLERAERARRLLLLRTLLDRLGPLPTPLTPAADAWRALKEAAARAPEPVDRLLLAPATGAWIAHLLRRIHGTATGPPLWAEAGHLCALAVTASVHAGTRADLRVPLTDGGLILPGLGLARLPDAQRGLTVGQARTDDERLTLTGPTRNGSPTTLTVRPAAVSLGGGGAAAGGAAAALAGYGRPDATSVARDGQREVSLGGQGQGIAQGEGQGQGQRDVSWLPLRTLAHRCPTGVVAIPLDDLDPYRDLDDPLPPARLDQDEAEAWQRLFEEAVAVLAERGGAGSGGAGSGGAGPGRFDPAAIRAVVPWGRTSTVPPAPPAVRVSASSGDSFGAMVIARPSSALALAETLVHEFQHSKLAALLHLFPLLDDDREERYYAPWRADPRHLTGLLHGAYAFTGVAGFWRDRLASVWGAGGREVGVDWRRGRDGRGDRPDGWGDGCDGRRESGDGPYGTGGDLGVDDWTGVGEDRAAKDDWAGLRGDWAGGGRWTGVGEDRAPGDDSAALREDQAGGNRGTGVGEDRAAKDDWAGLRDGRACGGWAGPRDGRPAAEEGLGARDDQAAAELAGYHFALRRLQSRLVVRTLLTEGRLTPQGRALVSGLARTLDGWLREPVPPAALARARTAAALHRTEWRLRNVVPMTDPAYAPDTPRFRPDRTSWPDVRTHAFATRPTAPRTADEHLAAGNPAAALAHYTDDLIADPTEPHTLAGWIVARAALDPGRTTRRMLARPELLQPLPSG